jgi:ribonuclease BN (tRNA processing enzyme)
MTNETSVQFLGSGDAFGSGGRLQTCIYVEAGATGFLLDCGASALSGMKRWGVQPNAIQAILLTHLHGDHFGGLPFFILEAQMVSRRSQPLTVGGPAGCEERIQRAQEALFPGSAEMRLDFPIEYSEWAARRTTRIGGLRVTPYPVIHESGAPSYALRVECEGKTIAYSGDTEWCHALIEAAQGADLFICEANFFDRQVRYHLNYRTLMAQREALGCKRLVLTHMTDETLARLGEVEVETAEDGKRIDL